jgi:acyl-homoserine lactone acylase PvdQ
VTYTAGVREERISNLVAALPPATATLDQMSTIQHDTQSTVGGHLAPVIRAALDGTTTAPDVAAYLAGLPAADAQRLATAKTLMDAWTLATPAAIDAPDPDSAATAVFNTWMHYFIIRAIKDEFDAMSFDVFRLDDNQIVRLIFGLLVHPDQFTQGPNGPVLCDDYTSATDDSCTKMVLVAMVDAMTQLESATGFNTPDTTQWRWGKLHHLTITPLFPNSALNLPTATESPLGFPKAGDNFVINRADMGWSDTDFSQNADGPAQRFLAQTVPGTDGGDTTIAVKWALPGGTIYDKRSPHYRDLLDNYYLPLQHFDAPFTVADIVAAGESRWDFK